MKKRLLSMLMAVCMVLTMMPSAAFADDSGLPVGTNNVVDSGEPVCTCTQKCTPAPKCTCTPTLDENNKQVHSKDCMLSNPEIDKEAHINPDCPVCGAENADLTKCNGMSADLPVAPVLASAVPLNITPRTKTLDLTTDSYKTEEGVVEENGVYTKSAEGWSYDTSDKTLTLSGVNMQSASNAPSYAIKLPDGAIITLADGTTSTVQSGNNTSSTLLTGSSYAIYCDGILTINGKGTLNATGGTTQARGGNSCGIYASSVTISGGTIYATGGEVKNGFSFGIQGETVTISSGTVNATGGSVTDTTGTVLGELSTGIFASDKISIIGGTVNATGGSVAAFETISNLKSSGITANNTISITGGIGKATGGTAITSQAFSKALAAGSLTLTGNWNNKTASWEGQSSGVTEQFSLPTGETYYFDLSGEIGTVTDGVSGKIGTINIGVPDTSLHYVPFTYAGTMNTYTLDSLSSGNTGASASATASDRSLFVADYNVSHTVTWSTLDTANFIFGKNFDTNYTIRSLSAGSNFGSGSGTPTTNEWDSILVKNKDWFKNWKGIWSWCQDTHLRGQYCRTMRGGEFAISSTGINLSTSNNIFGWRPALEVLDPATLGSDGLKAVTLNLNGGSFDTNGSVSDGVANSIKVVCAGNAFKAPSATGLTRPSGDNGTGFHWKGSDNKAYAVGDSVPNSVTTLTAQWVEAPSPVKVWDGTCALYFDGGSGTSADPYQIRTAEQLYLLSAVIGRFDFSNRRNYKDYVGYARKVVTDQEAQTNEYLSKAYYKLTADIILNDSSTFNNWIPIGRNYANDYNHMSLFSGSFDGCNHTIDGIRFGDGYTVILSVGLFSSNTSESTIKNVTIGSGYIHGNSMSGGLVGANRGTVENCINKAAISSQTALAGGVAGANDGIVKNCQNTGDITANAGVGGIVGSNTGKVENCQNIGKLSGVYNYIGGVVGRNTKNYQNYNQGTVTNCTSPKGLVPYATGDTGTDMNPSRLVCYRGHIIGNGDEGSSSKNSSGNVAKGLSISPSSWICSTTGSQIFTATVDNGTGDQSVIWSIINGDSSISVDKSGKVTVTSCDWDGKNYIIMATSTTDSNKYATASVTISIPSPSAPKITTTSLPNGKVGEAYSHTLAAAGYPAPKWSVTSGSLPQGLSLNETTGAITGTPVASGTSTFTVKATNASGSDSKELSIIVESPITSVSVIPATATVKKTKTQLFTADVEGTGDKTVTWSVNSTNSSIDKNGLLTVGGRETAATLTVKATSTVDSSKFATATVTVAAVPKVYTVTFDSDGGSDVSAISGIEEGSIIKLPNNPSKAVHRFDGWYTQKNGGGTQFTSATAVTNSITVYAKWTKLVTVSGIVVEEESETPISGAKVTLSPSYGTTTFTTNADGKFSFANIPGDYFTVTATFDDNSTVTVNVTGDYDNVKIVKPKPYLTITTQPKDGYIIKGIAGQSAVFNVLGKRTPHIADSVAYEWWWLNGAIPTGKSPDVKMIGSGSQMTINQGNGNIPDRGNYKLYALAYTNDTVPLEAYSRVATLKVVGVNTIEGVVKKDNAPVETAKVELVYADGAWPYGSVAKTSSTNPQTTGSDGKYKFELVPDGKYNLVITLPNGGKITYGPYDFPKTDPDKPIDIVIPDKAEIHVSGQPQDATVKNGAAVTLTTTGNATDGTALTYRWYKNTKNSNNGGTAIDGATTKSYTPATADKGTTYYYCVVSGGSLEAVTTRSAKVTVFTYGIIEGTVQTKDKQPIKGAKVELINIDNPVQTGFTTSQNPQTTIADGKYKFIEVPDGKYKLKVTLPGGEVFEVQPIDVPNVTPDIPLTPPDKPTINITSQPKNLTVAIYDTAEFTVNAGVSTGGKVMYQWYSNTTNSITRGKAIDGATAATYRAPTDAKGVTYYYCVAQATGANAVTSNIAKLIVRNTPVNNLITIEGNVVDEDGKKVGNAEVSLSPKAGTSENPQTTKVDGHYEFNNLPDGKYIITVKLPDGGVITKEIIINDGKITPTPPNNIDVPTTNSITITQQPKSIEATTDMTANFTAKATAAKAHVTYQWYKNTSNTNTGGTKLDGKTESTLKLDKQTEGVSYYYCVVSSTGANDVVTDVATLTVTTTSGGTGNLNGGVVDDEDGNPVKDATVKLMKNGTDGIQFGSTVTTHEDGKFQFTTIPYGSYSLVAQKDTSMVTRQITIKSASTTENLTMPSGAKITKVVIEGSNTPSAAVENLEAMFTGTDNTIAQQPGASVEIKLVVKQQDNPSDKDDIDAALTKNQHVGIYLDAKLVKTIDGTVTDDGTENIQPQAGQTLRIVLDLPTALQGKTGYQIIRSHTENGVTDVDVITPSYDSDLQTLSFDADAFSTYAVVYTQSPQYSVTVIGSQMGTGSGTGLYEAGQLVTIHAGSKSGYSFTGWTSNDNVSFTSTNSATTTFTMPAGNVTVTANWKSNGGGNNPGGNNDNNNSNGNNSGKSSDSSSEPDSSGGNNPGSSSDNGSNGGNNSNGNNGSGANTDNENNSIIGGTTSENNVSSSNLNETKDNALHQLAEKREQTIDSLPDSLTEEQQQAAMDEIDRIYTQAIKDINNADSSEAISDITNKAFADFTAVANDVGGEIPTQAVAGNAKPFVLLSAVLAAFSVIRAVQAWKRREDEETYGDNRKRRRKQIFATALAATAILLFLLTTGWNGITFANWWTIAVAIPTVGSLLFAQRNINK